MKRTRLIMVLVLLAATILTAGCTSGPATPAPDNGDALFAHAEEAFIENNLHAAEALYAEAFRQYKVEGNAAGAKKALDKASVSARLTVEFPYNRSEITALIDDAFPDVSAERKASWLPANQSQCITSDGEEWYFEETVNNIRFHNIDLMRQKTAADGKTPGYDDIKSIALAPAPESGDVFVNPITWDGTEVLSIPTDKLPKTGTFHLWFPLPIETESQRNVTIVSVEPAEYVISQTGTGSDIGLAYLEVPLEKVTGDFLNVTARFRFTQYERRFVIDPAKVGSYDTGDPEYMKYTAIGRNIARTPEIRAKAQEIVGNETNPYLQAEKIYWHIVNRSYSIVPHARIDAAGIPEAVYYLDTGFGDCGMQSMYFAALCRSLGIPARAIGGYQMTSGKAGSHFWSEYYLPGYGWIPNDVTIAESADWSFDATEEERHRFKAYYASSLDPYRYVIQKDVDIPLVPDPGDMVMFETVVQTPKAVCDTCDTDPELEMLDDWKVVMKKG